MIRRNKEAGFSLIELLLVLAIIGIISGIAIPAFVSQRRRARLIGDAQSNAQVLRMALETYKADSGVYGAVTGSNVMKWTGSGTISGTGASNIHFTPKGNSNMNYNLTVTGSGLLYTISVSDPSLGGAVLYTINQNGSGVITKY
jgi:prepilin-type N-terminal cleavage/methylation domain-containing protein